MATDVFQIPAALSNYDTNGKKIMVHDLTQPEASSTVMMDIPKLLGLEELTLLTNGQFSMPAKRKLNNVFIKNNTNAAMTITFSGSAGSLVVVSLDADGEVDVDFGKTFWTADTILVTGVTSSITLLIDRK